MKFRNFIFVIGLIMHIAIHAPISSISQVCSGNWVSNRPLTFECISGQLIGESSPFGDPPGCPIIPIYTILQSNTFVFDNPVNDFFVDFNAFDCTSPGCPRMEIKINGVFFPLNTTNLFELPFGTNCFGSVSFLTVTSEGYISSNIAGSNGQGRLVFSGVNASSITISTNDKGGGIVVANPCFAPLPIQIKSFKGFSDAHCAVKLEFESGIESTVRNIEVQGSMDGNSFSTLLELLPKGSDSRYMAQLNNSFNSFFRLKVNDLDGSSTYSKIIRVNNDCANPSARISPNPSISKIIVENIQAGDELVVFDATGRGHIRQQALSNNTVLSIQQLPTGIYFLTVLRKHAKIETIKFLKK